MAQVVPLSAEIDQLNTNIVAISFGTTYWANAWQTKTNAPFPIWLDPNRDAYPVYGLEQSAWASWGPKNLWYYAKALLRGERLEKSGEDVTQLGGNFIVDSNGIVRFAYPSKDPTDRPTTEQIMNALRQLKA